MAMNDGRLMILGLDGATLDLIRPWAEAGILPTFQKLMREGSWGPLRSTMPPLTPAAWSSFITGVNPGKHGIFEFYTSREDRGQALLAQSTSRHAPSLWQIASQAGKNVIVYNVPVTYPPERVNGVMVSGLMTPPGASDACYPPELQPELEKLVPHLGFARHGVFKPGHEAEFVAELIDNHQKNFRILRYLMDRNPWDLLVMVFQHTDTMGHFMWRHMEEKGAGLPDSVREVAANAMQACYQDVDAKLGELIKEAGEGTHVFIVSDHGHGRMMYSFATNTWLHKKGYLRLKQDPSTRLKYLLYRLGFTKGLIFGLLTKLGIGGAIARSDDDKVLTTRRRFRRMFISMEDTDWARTRAYSYGPYGPIFINQRGRTPHGIVNPGKEYEALLDQLIADLLKVKEPGTDQPLFPEIHRGRDVYSGPFVERGPDLVYYPKNWNYAARGNLSFDSRNPITGVIGREGNHRMDGILFLSGPGIEAGCQVSGASIMDVAPTALALLGLPVPQYMDGRVLENVMDPKLRDELSIRYEGETLSMPDFAPVAEMSSEDEAVLIDRLRDLGYIG
jgi:predicted AlkP superfamily phosphohydrolase/phosphomutase